MDRWKTIEISNRDLVCDIQRDSGESGGACKRR